MHAPRLARHGHSHSTAVALLALALGLGGCIEKRPRRNDRAAAEAAPKSASIVDPAAVDGALDHLIEGERFQVAVDADDAAEGAAQPLVTIVEFSDFECPFCGKLAANLAAMVLRYPEDVRLVFKQFPLPMHAHAEPAARATVAAGAQGKFWEMHDALFADRTKLGDEALVAHAKDLGLDMTRFAKDFAAPETLARVQAETNEGRVVEVQSTPTFFINGRKITGAKDADALALLIDEEIATAKKLMAAGAKRPELYARFMHAAKPGAGQPKTADPAAKRGEASKVANYAVGLGPGRPTTGPDDALVTIVAYADYGCTECAAAHGRLASVIEAHPEVRVSLRFLPQSPGAQNGARVALAAGLQGKLWAAHRSLVAVGAGIEAAPLRKLAEAQGLDMARFDTDLESPRVLAMLEEDKAVVENVRGTAKPPFFFVNGRFLEHTASVQEFETLIAEESKKAELFIASESLTRAQAFESMRQTWRGFKVIDAVPKAPIDAVPAAVPAAAADPAKGDDLANTPVRGDAKLAKVTVVACTDFDCPACARGAKILGELTTLYGDALALEYRHLLPPGRNSGETAHFAAIAAGQQGKFWEMHDALYANRSARSDAALEKLATEIGLDVAKWNTDRKSERLRPRVEEDTAACGSLGLTGLPAWKVGDELILGAQPKSRFVKAIDAAIAK